MIRPGFSLIELLIVLAIIVATAGMIAGVTTKDKREGAVRAAAEELAATLRLARSKAVDQAAIVGVSFNIRNGAGTTGLVLNNYDGGHWYRIIGCDEYTRPGDYIPAMSARPSGIPRANFYTATTQVWQEGQTLQGFLKQIQGAWVGDRHTLTPKKVRFLALSDQDNGSLINPVLTSGTQTYVGTYPRPWFGTWVGGRLYPWAGYNPTILDAGGRACSGFYYQGDDGTITGCRNHANRSTTWETSSPKYGIFTKDDGRPVVNGDWLDYVICFYPDGSAQEQQMAGRLGSYYGQGAAGGGNTGGIGKGDLGDMTGCSAAGIGAKPAWPAAAMTSYVDFTGNYAITLAPDVDADTDVFPSAQSALSTLLPAYRVTISRRGQVKVVKVLPHEPAGSTITYLPAVNWNNLTDLRANYRYLYRTTISGSTWIRHGSPVSTYLTATLLDGTGGQRWWTQP